MQPVLEDCSTGDYPVRCPTRYPALRARHSPFPLATNGKLCRMQWESWAIFPARSNGRQLRVAERGKPTECGNTDSKLFLPNNTFSFLDHKQAIGSHMFQNFLPAAQPLNHDTSCLARTAQAKMQSQIAL